MSYATDLKAFKADTSTSSGDALSSSLAEDFELVWLLRKRDLPAGIPPAAAPIKFDWDRLQKIAVQLTPIEFAHRIVASVPVALRMAFLGILCVLGIASVAYNLRWARVASDTLTPARSFLLLAVFTSIVTFTCLAFGITFAWLTELVGNVWRKLSRGTHSGPGSLPRGLSSWLGVLGPGLLISLGTAVVITVLCLYAMTVSTPEFQKTTIGDPALVPFAAYDPLSVYIAQDPKAWRRFYPSVVEASRGVKGSPEDLRARWDLDPRLRAQTYTFLRRNYPDSLQQLTREMALKLNDASLTPR